MKEIKAYVREERLPSIAQALRTAGAHEITTVRVLPVETEGGPSFVDISLARPIAHFRPMVKLELVCSDAAAGKYVDLIQESARTGQPGDGIIFVSSIEEAVHIRSGNRGDNAL
ncbi:MAG: P-II family nitrogen regulator [Acidobacteriota bacterium]|nr:P-II family nitrogen regulator [Acidobacteriota bacterium]